MINTEFYSILKKKKKRNSTVFKFTRAQVNHPDRDSHCEKRNPPNQRERERDRKVTRNSDIDAGGPHFAQHHRSAANIIPAYT